MPFGTMIDLDLWTRCRYIYGLTAGTLYHIQLSLNAFSHFTNDINYCKTIKRFLLLDFHCEFHVPVYFMYTEYNSG